MIKTIEIPEFFCDSCGEDIKTRDGCPCFHDDSGNVYCIECGVKRGLVDPIGYLYYHGFGIAHHAVYENGKVIAFQKCGRGFTKYVFPIGNDD